MELSEKADYCTMVASDDSQQQDSPPGANFCWRPDELALRMTDGERIHLKPSLP